MGVTNPPKPIKEALKEKGSQRVLVRRSRLFRIAGTPKAMMRGRKRVTVRCAISSYLQIRKHLKLAKLGLTCQSNQSLRRVISLRKSSTIDLNMGVLDTKLVQ